MIAKKQKQKQKRKPSRRVFERKHFESVVIKNKLTYSDIVEMHKKGLIGDNDYLFTLEGVINIAYVTAKGFHANCRQLNNHKTRWARDVAAEDARMFINDAFR